MSAALHKDLRDTPLASWEEEEIKVLNPDSGLEIVLDIAQERPGFQGSVGVSEEQAQEKHILKLLMSKSVHQR